MPYSNQLFDRTGKLTDEILANIVRGDMADPRDFHTPQPSYSKEDLLKSSEGGNFGPGSAQLPAPPMLMMERITELSLDGGEFGKGHDRDFWS